ncbi:MAG: helix-turn-helix domain-containing protein [Candidatus Bathyarchaeia archaeon]
MKNEGELSVRIKFDGNEVEFSGDVDQVTRFFLKFLIDHYPSIKIISELKLTIDIEDLLRNLKGILAISDDEVLILPPRGEMSDKEHILLILLKRYLESKLSLEDEDQLTMKEIVSQSGESKNTVSGRLSELVSEGMVKRVERGKYRVTPLGIKYLIDNVVPDLRVEASK